MLELIIDYVVKIGGPIVVISGAMFFVLRHYVTERIKSDFAKQLEDVRQKNQTAIEVLRGTTQRDLESLKSSLEISRNAARILIERRIQFYEEYFRSLHVLNDALNELRGVFETEVGEDNQQLRIAAEEKFFAALGDFTAWSARSVAFVPKGLHPLANKLSATAFSRKQAIAKLEFNKCEAEDAVAIECEVEADHMIRADLAAIQKTGSLPPD
jgi:hypothetical protein